MLTLSERVCQSMELSDRKKKILQVVVDEYIADGEPISSKAIHERHLTELSSATIRSELAQLEELGYLGHPHTSAGRVPLSKAYRFYVEKLLRSGRLNAKTVDYIQENFRSNYAESEDLVRDAAKVISELTEYPAMTKLSSGSEKIEDVKLVPLKANSILLIVLTESSVLKDTILYTSGGISERYLETAAGILRELFCGKTLEEAGRTDERSVGRKLEDYRELFERVIDVLRSYAERGAEEIAVEGGTNIFKYSEFNDIEKTKNFLAVMSDRTTLSKLLSERDGSIEFSVRIGSEAGSELPEDLAMVSASFRVGGKNVEAGVIGPVRMDYQKVFDVLKTIEATLLSVSDAKKE